MAFADTTAFVPLINLSREFSDEAIEQFFEVKTSAWFTMVNGNGDVRRKEDGDPERLMIKVVITKEPNVKRVTVFNFNGAAIYKGSVDL